MRKHGDIVLYFPANVVRNGTQWPLSKVQRLCFVINIPPLKWVSVTRACPQCFTASDES